MPNINFALRGRLLLAVAFVAALLIPFTAAAAPSRQSSGSTGPTIVLVHGAWADSNSWAQVQRRLSDDGFRTAAPDLKLNSLADDVAVVRATLDAIPGKKVLVAHSYGGMVASAAAYGRTDVVGLVYTAAFVPDQLDSIVTLGIGYQQSTAFQHLAFTGAPFASPGYIAPDLFHQYFAQDLSAGAAAVMDSQQRPLNFPIVLTPSGPVAWHTLPCWYAVSGQDRMIDPAEEAHMASRAHCTTVTYGDASHVGGMTRHASAFVALVETAASH